MHVLRLFHVDDPARELERRALAGGAIRIGRGPGADWIIDDPSLTLSRRHCEIASSGGALTVRDLSANGAWIGDPGRRLERGRAEPIRPGEPLRLGSFLIRAERAGPQLAAEPPAAGETAASSNADKRLFEAFCQGAGLDPAGLRRQSAEAVLRAAGEVWAEMARGLHQLMQARARERAELELDGTRIQAEGDNPFRWAGGGQRLGLDLLAPPEGLAPGKEAVRAAVADLLAHAAEIRDAGRRASERLLDSLAPEALAADAGRGLLRERRLWQGFVQRRARLRAGITTEDAPVWRAALAGRLAETYGSPDAEGST
ncbi:MAG TPA: type VI secretion system-associated FHA domain protein [Caulobacteraceae bacterium]|nr:type VI secretion system-associated FHA domain protein [Caulobacteraceae bacterium]